MIELKRILVPLDGSVLAERALPMAVSLAQKFDSHIVLLRVLDGMLMSKFRIALIDSEFMFEFFNSIGPFNRFSLLVVEGNKSINGSFQSR